MNTNHTPDPDPGRPADTRMMGLVHSALRRDLVRTRTVLSGPPVSAARRTALSEHLLFMMDFLHHHHEGEDVGLYPMLLDRDPSSAAVLAEMDAEHRVVEPAADALVRAAGGFGRGDVDQDTLAGAVAALESVLLPHLRREETVLMPLVSAAITDREWQDWTEGMKSDTAKLADLAFEGHWLLDGLDPEGRVLVLGLVPPAPRFVLAHLLGGRYRRRAAVLWGGTAAATIGSVDLAATEIRS